LYCFRKVAHLLQDLGLLNFTSLRGNGWGVQEFVEFSTSLLDLLLLFVGAWLLHSLAGFFLFSSFLGIKNGLSFLGEGIRIQFDKSTQVLEGILLSNLESFLMSDWAEMGLNFVRVDDTSNIRVGEQRLWEFESFLLFAIKFTRSKDRVELFECRFSPNNKSSRVSSRSELKEIQSRDMAEFNTRNVSEGLNNLGSSFGSFLFFVVNNKRTLLLNITSSSGLSFTSTKVTGILDSFNIRISTNSFQKFDSIFSLGNVINFNISNDQWDFRQFFNMVTTSHNQRSNRGSSQSSAGSISALSLGDSNVPSSPDVILTKHATTTTHVSKGSLA